MRKITSFKYHVSKKLATLLLLFSSSLGYAQYCTPSFTEGCSFDDDINTFILNGENSTGFNDVNTGCSAGSYDDRTAQVAVDLAQGVTYTATISSQYNDGSGGDYCTIWIDFNNNNTFEASEMVTAYNSFLALTGSPVPIAIPAAAALGGHRMRVMVGYPYDVNFDPLTAENFDPCGNPNNTEYAEVHDYSITIVGPPSCVLPSALNVTGITSSSATLGWTENGTATQWNVQYGTTGFALGTGTSVSASATPSYTISSGLSTGISYDFYVRAACSVTDLSSWAGPFTFGVPPANDECTTAQSITPTATCSPIAGSNLGGTPSSPAAPASCVDFVSGSDVWYSFQAINTDQIIDLSDIVAVNTNAAYYECGMVAYSGSCNALTPLSCTIGGFDGSSQIDASLALSNLTIGETYYIRIWSDYAEDNLGNLIATDYTFNLCVKEVPRGARCSDPLVVNASPYTFSGNTGDYGNFYQGAPGTGCGSTSNYLSGNDVVFSYTASADGSVDISLTNLGDTYAGMFVYNDCNAIGNSCAAGVVNGNTSTDLAINTFNVTANTTYYIVISTWAAPQTVAFTLNINGTAPLPVEMGQLKGALTNGNTARLSWATFKEQNNKGFAVQRSDNGKDFSDIGFVASKAKNGNSAEALSYTFNDLKIVTGASYYRLQQTDRDGKITSSNVVRLSAKEEGVFTITATPNPVTDLLTIQTKGIPGNQPAISISDVTGKQITTIPVNGNKTIVNMNGLPAGLFFIKYTDAEHTQTIKISKR